MYQTYSQNTTVLTIRGTLNIDYMFRPLYWPSSGCTQLIKQLYNVCGIFWGDEISFTKVSGMNTNLMDWLH